MKYQWLDESLTAEKLSLLIGKSVKSITQGEIIIGYEPDGKPVIQMGIEVELDEEPSEEQLNKIDLLFAGLRRAGGKTIADKIEEIEGKIETLEAKAI